MLFDMFNYSQKESLPQESNNPSAKLTIRAGGLALETMDVFAQHQNFIEVFMKLL